MIKNAFECTQATPSPLGRGWRVVEPGEGHPMRPSRQPRSPAPSRSRFCSGFTLIEVIVIVLILGILAAVIAPRFIQRVGQSKRAVAESNAASLATAMRLFIADHGSPESGATIDILWERPGNVEETKWQPYVENPEKLLDPWGNKFALKIPGDKNPYDFDIISYGSDGKPGGEAEAADIIKP